MSQEKQLDFFIKPEEKNKNQEVKMNLETAIEESLKKNLSQEADGKFKPSLAFFPVIITDLMEKGAVDRSITKSDYEFLQVKIAQKLMDSGYSKYFTPAITRLLQEQDKKKPILNEVRCAKPYHEGDDDPIINPEKDLADD